MSAVALDSSSQNTESYSLDRAAGLFDYTRIFTPEEGAGVHIQLTLGYTGFLGSRSVLASDFLTLVVLGLLFSIAFLVTGRFFGFDDTQRIRARVSLWVGGAKAQLTQHGVHIREMVRQSQRLAACTGRSRELVRELRSKIHGGLTELHESREFYKEGETIAARAETLALNMAIEANRLGGDARRIADMATELHRRIQALHSVNRKGQSLIQRLERRIEPWSTDADLTFHAFDDVKDATDLLSRHIRSTTESLMGQAKLIQGLNQELGAHEPVAAPKAIVAVEEASRPTVVAAPTPAAVQSVPAAAQTSHPPQLPEPLPPLEESEPKPLFRRMRAKKSA
jgi:hypothetical protein